MSDIQSSLSLLVRGGGGLMSSFTQCGTVASLHLCFAGRVNVASTTAALPHLDSQLVLVVVACCGFHLTHGGIFWHRSY